MLQLRAPCGSGAKNPAVRLLHCDWLAYLAREQPGRSIHGHETRCGSQRKASLLIKTLTARMCSSTFTGALCIWKWTTPEFMGPHFGTTIFPCIYLFFRMSAIINYLYHFHLLSLSRGWLTPQACFMEGSTTWMNEEANHCNIWVLNACLCLLFGARITYC